MQIWVGLGNPGAKYALQRHNVGFMAADIIAEAHDFGPWQQEVPKPRRRRPHRPPASVLLLKPQTFMNDSGDAVQQALRFYKLDLDDAHRLPRRARPRAVQGQGEASAAAPPATTACARSMPLSAPISAASASASAIPDRAEGDRHAARPRQLRQGRDGAAVRHARARSPPRPNGSPTATTPAS